MKVLLLLASLSLSFAQDTHYCPDGWTVVHFPEQNVGPDCILLGPLNEKVTKEDADVICASHDGWLVDLDEGPEGKKNYYIKSLVKATVGQGLIGIPGKKFGDQWWLGAKVNGPHGDHNWGNWQWEHSGAAVAWYDWMDGEPNDWNSQDCLTYLRYDFWNGDGYYQWNDWGCENVAHYICEKPCINCN